jgi:hypothetical protein
MQERAIRLVAMLLVLLIPSLAYAQGTGPSAVSQADLNASIDRRLAAAKAALQLTPDQRNYWPPVEDAVRAAAQARYQRVAAALARICPRDQVNPVEFLRRRANALAQRASELKNFVDAWEPLFQDLTPDQKRRSHFLVLPRVTPLVIAPH